MSLFDWSEYSQTEKPALELLQELGYKYKEGKEFSPQYNATERSSLREVIFSAMLTKKIKDLNPWIDDSSIKQIFRKLTIPATSSQVDFNEQIWEYLTKPSKLVVEQDLQDGKGRRNQWVKLIDWGNPEKNEFLVVNQFKVNASRGNRIPDIVIFINGLPLVVIECKSPLLTNPLQQGIRQVIEYQETIPKLFYLNQLIIVTSSQSAVYGVLGNSYNNFQIWKDPYPITIAQLEKIVQKTGRSTPDPTPQDVLLYGLLEKRNLLDLIRNFIIFETSRGKLNKKIARYQQFRATNKTLTRILTEKDSELRGGTIWHTQGSGKSLTMLFTSIKLRRAIELNNPLLVFVCDRIDLVNQLNSTFERCGFTNPSEARSVDHLQELIRIGQGVTIFTTIQKFRTKDADARSGISKSGVEFPELNKGKNIFVIVDEAHRSQYKIFGMNMRMGMPNACYLAYTGTPLARNEKNETISVGRGKTVSKFGQLIDSYDLRQSVEDSSTVKILYENRLPELNVEGESIDEIFNRVFAAKTTDEREKIKQKYATEDAILAAPERVKKVVLDLLKHYEEHIEPNGFKAQIVTASRKLAVMYKKYLDGLNSPESVVIISANLRYDNELKALGANFITEKLKQQEMIDRFKDKNDPLKFLIVCDMLITGFDAPIEQVMYLDKRLTEHNLLQAIARVNRIHEDKNYGLIVDYYGVSNHLERALEIFDKPDIEGFMKSIESELYPLEQYHKKVLSYFDDVDVNDLEACIIVLEPESVRADFHNDFKKFSQSMDVVLPDPRAQPYLADLKRFGMILKAAKNRYREEQLNLAGCGEKVQKIIDEHIRSTNIKILVEPVSILSEKFQEALDSLKSEKSKASEMQHAIQHEISVKIDEDPVFYRSLKERLEEIIEMYIQNRIDLAEKIMRLKALYNEVRERPNLALKMGLNSAELAFFNLLKDASHEVGIEDDREIVKFTYEILEAIEQYVTLIDWIHKSDILRQIRKASKLVFHQKGIEKSKQSLLAHQIEELAKVHFPSK